MGASEVQPGAGLAESEAWAPASPAGEGRGAVAGAAGHPGPGLLPPPRRGLRGALTDQRASLGCRLSDVCVCKVFVQLLAITFEREFPNQRVLRNL